MIKFDIKNRWSGAVQFTAEIACEASAPLGWKIRLALEWALTNKASIEAGVFDGGDFARFDGARFVGASFDGASFVGASFDGARFVDARFDGARFDGASFVGASFDGARFVDARFDGARFDGARFDGARFDDASFDGARFDGARFDGASFDNCIGRRGEKLVGPMPLLSIGPIGSRAAPLYVESYADGAWVFAGCWNDHAGGPLDGFRTAVAAEHGENRHARDYLALADFIEGWAARQRAEAAAPKAAEAA